MRLYSKSYSYHRLNDMVDAAVNGTFSESDYTESELSKLEVKWMRFLNVSALSRENLEKERRQLQELVSDISHQTKTPLSNLKLYTELLQEQLLPQESRALVDKICQQTNRLEFLIQALVKMSRLETGTIQVKVKNKPVSELMDGLKALGTAKAKDKNISLIFRETPDMWAYYDEKWTLEAIYNILDNGIKYSPPQSSIRIEAEAYEMFVRISVEDQGIGITEEEQAQIFSRFYRSDRVQQEDGVGLGLYLARQIIRKGKGYIKVSSNLDKGSKFHVYLTKEPVV